MPDAFNIDENWISDRTFGIAHGPMLVMIENARTGLIWKSFMSNRHIQAGIRRAGFRRNLDPYDISPALIRLGRRLGKRV